jgi:hypothetical protein
MIAWISSATLALVVGLSADVTINAAEPAGVKDFRKNIKPLLEKYCYDCHADGANKGSVSFDEFKTDQAVLEEPDLWLRALKNLRANMMPPARKPQPTAKEKQIIERWIKDSVFAIDPKNPDPGHVTLRRLNRVEYENTVRDLIGVNFDAQMAFPPDDSGHGFDNISDVLTLSPMLLEKYVMAANRIVNEAVPSASRVVRERVIQGREFRGASEGNAEGRGRRPGGLSLSYYQPAVVSNTFNVKIAGKYELALNLMVNERFVDGVFDYNKCRLIMRVDGKEMCREEFGWQGGKPYSFRHEADWPAGDHELTFELQPLTPDEKQTRSLSLQISSVVVQGPMAKEHWVRPPNYDRFFKKEVPEDAAERQAYARELLGDFARRAFRRPVDEPTLKRLVELAGSVSRQPDKTFEAGIAQAMVAILASPRFLFREERAEAAPSGKVYPYVDEYSLASRLSYFLWSSMPDEELFRLAGQGQLRKNLSAQVDRMLKDKRAEALIKDFAGQWLRTRDIENVPLEARFILAREEKFDAERTRNRARFRELNDKSDEQLTPEEKEELANLRSTFRRGFRQPLRAEMSRELRSDMRQETERTVAYILREDRSLLELVNSDYSFLNERLARHYGIPDVKGDELRLVKLSADSPRGGILTQGTMLGVTSNPTRTSPVKRGVFILENILGTPPPPPPPDIPPLEEATKNIKDRAPTLRETLAAHRENALCSSCHNRMDPIGLAFENFNAMGMWREREYDEPIDPAGKLITGQEFSGIRELKQILVRDHSLDFYRTVAEKLLTYALGRGLEYYDVETVDRIVERLRVADGRPSALIAGVVESAPFLKTRGTVAGKATQPARPVQQRADAQTRP